MSPISTIQLVGSFKGIPGLMNPHALPIAAASRRLVPFQLAPDGVDWCGWCGWEIPRALYKNQKFTAHHHLRLA